MNSESKLSPYSGLFWLILLAGLTIILLLTMVTDYWLTGQQPNPLFYIFVPPVDILGSAVASYFLAWIIHKPLKFLDTLAIFIGVTILIQTICEIGFKVVYYYVWQYPGIIWIILCFAMALGLTTFAFIRWTQLNWSYAILVTITGYLAGTAAAILITNLTGLSTPGS
jgi:hypothetical protein